MGEHFFTWVDRNGEEQNLNLEDSNCNHKASVLRTDYAQVTEKSMLPVTKIYYGPLEFEMDKMEIIVGPLLCNQADLETQYSIEDHINRLDDAIENIVLAQNRTQEQVNDLQNTVNEQTKGDSLFFDRDFC